jgi:hypothetical protein
LVKVGFFEAKEVQLLLKATFDYFLHLFQGGVACSTNPIGQEVQKSPDSAALLF